MIVTKFATLPDFPFEWFHEDVSQFIQAQEYWFSLLRSAKGFEERDWHPVDGGAELADLQYSGTVAALLDAEWRRKITILTTSIPAHANMLATENPGYSEKDLSRLRRAFGPDFTLDDVAVRGLTSEEALARAATDARVYPVTVAVRTSIIWHPIPNHPDGGVEREVEHFTLTSEISERAEPLALHALEMFLEPGATGDRVNDYFSDAEAEPRRFDLP